MKFRKYLTISDTYQLSQSISGSSEPRVTNVPSEFLSLLSYALILICYYLFPGDDSTYWVKSAFSSRSLAINSFASLNWFFNCTFSSSRKASLSESNC